MARSKAFLKKTSKYPTSSELIKTNPLFFKSFYSSPVAKALIFLKSGKYIEVNNEFLKLFECSRKQVIGKSPDELNLWANKVERNIVLKEYSNNSKRTFEFDIKSLKKNIKNIILSFEKIEINGDKYLLGDHLDNTYKKDFEKRLMQSEEQYKLLFYKNPLPMWIYDFDSFKFVSVNNAAIKHYGYSKNEFLKMRITDIRPKEEVKKYLKFRENILDNRNLNKSYNAGIWKHKKKNGELIDVEITRSAVEFDGKKAILILANDITSVLKAQKNLRKKNEEMNLLYNATRNISSTLDPNKVYKKIYKIVPKLIPCDGMTIASYDDESKLIICKAAWVKTKRLDVTKFPEMPLDTSGIAVQSNAIISRKSIILNDFEAYTRKNTNVMYIYNDNTIRKRRRKKDNVNKSALIVPMLNNGKAIGVIQVFSYRENAYNKEHIQLIETFSSELSTSTVNAQLYVQAQNEIKFRKDIESKLLKSTKNISDLYQISKDLSSSLDNKELYDKVNKIIYSSYPECDIGISIYDEKNKFIKLESLLKDGEKINTANTPVIKFDESGKGLQSSVIKSKKTRVVENYKKYLKKSVVKFYINDNGAVSYKKTKSFSIAESALIVPLLYKGKVLGTIQLLNFSEKPFTVENIRIIEALAAHISVSYMNAKLFHQAQNEISEKHRAEKALKDKTEELQILYEAQRVLSGSLDIEAIYDKIYKIISQNIPCDSMIISSYNSSNKMIEILSVWSDGIKPDINIFPAIPLAPDGYGIQSQVIRTGESLLINNYRSYYKKTKTRYRFSNDKAINRSNDLYNSGLIIPMKHEGSAIGIIQLLSYSKNAYSYNNLKLLESLSGPISAATFNASLYKKARLEIAEKHKAREELALRNKEITLLYRAGRELLSTLDLEEVYDILYLKVKDIIPCDSMIISEYNSSSNKIICKAAWVENSKHNAADFPPLHIGSNYKGTQIEAIVTGNSKIVNNFYETIKKRKDKYYFDNKGNVLNYKISEDKINKNDPVVKSAIYVPMKLGKNVIGVISAFSYKENAYSEYDLKMLESITVHVSVASANAELYKRSQNEISERIKKEEELKQIRKNLENAQRIAHIGSWMFDVRTKKIFNSVELYKILGIDINTDGFIFNDAMTHVHPDDRESTSSKLLNAISQKISYENEDRIVRPNGEIRNVKIVGEPIYDVKGNYIGMQGTLQDITEIKKINDELVRSLEEKELMLKEIHHRVKNNLQVVSSLLRLQAEKIEDKTIAEYFKLSEQRVKSMGLIHQQLYKTKDLSRINFKEYMSNLCSYLHFAYDTTNRIKIDFNLEEIYFGIDTALPCGLIINELFTNAVKHAFPDGRNGNIYIGLCRNSEGEYCLTIKDDGRGIKNPDFKNSSSLGMELVNTLTEQIEGEIFINSDNGTEIQLKFKEVL